jgi:hypothetical protein
MKIKSLAEEVRRIGVHILRGSYNEKSPVRRADNDFRNYKAEGFDALLKKKTRKQ